MNKLKNFISSNTREEKIKRLNDAIKSLKSEFIGLDDIIDQIKESISPWYITPEILERPVIISLWGMTGTGKSSVVKRLIELLGLSGKSIFFDCGQESEKTYGDSLDSKFSSLFGSSDIGDVDIDMSNFVIVLDEFQFARTLNEAGAEETKSSNRPIWKLIDDGILEIHEYRYDNAYYSDYVSDWKFVIDLNESYKNIPIKKGKIQDKDMVNRLMSTTPIGLYYFNYISCDEEAKPVSVSEIGCSPSENKNILEVLNTRILKLLSRSVSRTLNDNNIINNLMSITTLGDLINELYKYKDIVTKPTIIDCSKSLIFIVGNLDEAYNCSGELNPDIDADTFHEITSNISTSDIKAALKYRFRAEQISRMGNNLIKYPTLDKNSFIRIIKKETNRILSKLKETTNIDIVVDESIIGLIYSEGVYPTQGTRPLFSTINTIISPLLSEILLNIDSNNKEKVLIKIKNEEDWKEKNFRIESTIISIIIGDKTIDKTINLDLGRLRTSKNKKTIYPVSVHEAGHAVVFALLFKKSPIDIISSTVNSGGFCVTYNKDIYNNIESKYDIDRQIKVKLAGYIAEHTIYKDDQDRCLMGSSSDIKDAWDLLSDCVYKSGYFSPIKLESKSYSMSYIPNGASDDFSFQNDEVSIKERCYIRFSELIEETKNLIGSEINLIKQIALYLGKNGRMDKNKFKEYVTKYGNSLDVKNLDNEDDDDYYYSKLIKD